MPDFADSMLRTSHYREIWPIISTHVSHFWLRFSDNKCGRTCSIQHVKYTTNSCTRPTYFKYTNFSTTYHRSAHFKDFSSRRQSENTKYKEVYRKYPSLANKSRWVNARLRVPHFTHPAHQNSSFRLSYLLRQFLWAKREKYDRQGRKYNERKNKQQQTRKSTQGNNSLFRKLVASQRPAPIK